jgi:hypothetical protein
MGKLLTEDIYRIQSLMGIIKEQKISLPIIVKGSYSAKGQKNPGDALHSFEKRKSDGFGGRMSTKIKEKLLEVYKAGVNPDVKDIKINIDSKNLFVEWEATIDESKDGKAYMGISTVGSAGNNADRRAERQVKRMMKWVDKAEDYELVLDFKNPSGIYIRQFFYKYTLPSKYPPYGSSSTMNVVRNDQTQDQETDDTSNVEKYFSSWTPGEYKIKDDETWTYNLTPNKEWEASKDGASFTNLKTELSPENYLTALETLKTANKV